MIKFIDSRVRLPEDKDKILYFSNNEDFDTVRCGMYRRYDSAGSIYSLSTGCYTGCDNDFFWSKIEVEEKK